MKLTTKIRSVATGEEFPCLAEQVTKSVYTDVTGDTQVNFYVMMAGIKSNTGCLTYSTTKSHIRLEYLNSDVSEFQKTGTAGIEYLFRLSIQCGLEGKITTKAAHSAHIFYWKLGFRFSKKYDRVNVFGNDGGIIELLIRNYLITSDRSTRLLYRDRIFKYRLFADIYNNAEKKLKQSLDPDDDFELIVNNGLYYNQREVLNRDCEANIESRQRCDTSHYGLLEMYLPEDARKMLAKQFDIVESAIFSEQNDHVSQLGL